jgi:amidase
MKPTALRLPTAGWASTMAGQENVPATIGPLSTSLEGCKIFVKAIIDAKPWLTAPVLLPLAWKSDDAFRGRKMKVAVLWDDGVVKPHPPVTRALEQVVEKLKGNANVELSEWKPYKHDLAWEIIVWNSRSSVFGIWVLIRIVTGKLIFRRRWKRRTGGHG